MPYTSARLRMGNLPMLPGSQSGVAVRGLSLLLVLLGTLLAACDSAPSDSPGDAVQQQLVGTWLREYQEQGTQVRRICLHWQHA